MTIIAKLIRAGVDPELVAEVADALAASGADRSRALRAERQARWRAKKAEQASTERLQNVYKTSTQRLHETPDEASTKRLHVDVYNPPKEKKGLPPAPPSKENPTLPLLDLDSGISGIKESSKQDSSSFDDAAPSTKRSAKDAFDEFWKAYPKKTGRDAAKRKFVQLARSKEVTFEELMAGLDRYKRLKEPDCPWCNPATWLNQGRWADEYGNVVPIVRRTANSDLAF